MTDTTDTTDTTELAERLRDETSCWLATTRPSGRAHLTPIWFAFVDERFWMCTTPDAVKVRNIAARSEVSVSLESAIAPVVAEGHARVHTGPPFPPAVVAAFVAKFDWDIDHDEGPWTALIEVEIDRWLMRGAVGR